MPALTEHHAASITKALVIGNPGVGKTGLIGSLANAGYRCFIWDFDNGLDILLDPKVLKPENRKNVFFKTFTDKLSGPRATPVGVPTALQHSMDTFNSWKDPGPVGPDGKPTWIDRGSATTWGEKDVIILDSLTMFGDAAMRFVLSVAGHLGKPAQMQHWGEAIRIQEGLLQLLYSDAVKCNVVVNAHITYIGEGEGGSGVMRGYPSALGQKLPPKVGRYFNSVLMLEKQVRGVDVIRRLKTSATYQVDLKNPAPSVIPPEMEPDLAKYFELVRKGASNA